MSNKKITILYTDGQVEVIYGENVTYDGGVFQIDIETTEDYDYVYIPFSVVKRVTENG